MIPWTKITVLVAAASLALAAEAHAPGPEHPCRAPARTADEQNDAHWQGFLESVDGFRRCVSDFVSANQAAAQAHNEAARLAAAAWNGFVRSSLNVPQDFPWPPDND